MTFEPESISVLRAAVDDDVPALLRLMVEFNADESIAIEAPALEAGIREVLGDASIGAFVLAEVGGVPAGYGLYSFGYDIEFGGRLGFVNELFVVQRYRGKGVGTALLRELERRVTERGAKAVQLLVRGDNGGAQALYRRNDYHFDPRMFMTKRLDA